MKVAMYSIDRVFERRTGGVRRFLELMDALAAAGHEVHLFSADDTAELEKRGIPGRSIHKEHEENGRSFAGLKAAFGNRTLFQAIKKERFDRIVVFDVRAAFSLVINAVGAPDLFLRQDLMSYKKIQLDDARVPGYKRFLLLAVAQMTEALCLACARKIVVQCQFDLNEILRRHVLLKKQIERKASIQINNINPSWIVGEERAIRPEPDHAPTYDLAFVGNFRDSRKGHDLLLPALRELAQEGLAVRTAIIGDGKHLEECRFAYADMKNLCFLGRLSDPIPVVADSRLLIVPSYADSCPNTVMEGLYHRVPVIGANRSGIPEILNHPAWCFEMDVPSVKTAIRQALEPEANAALRAGQEKRREELLFDWGKKMTELVES